MRVLILCEFSGVVRDAFSNLGHYAVSCDVRESVAPGKHLRGDLRTLNYEDWDLVIAHPPCTYVCGSGIHWNSRVPGREVLTVEALDLFRFIWALSVPRLCVENPIGLISTHVLASSQIIQPYEFGHPESKATALWLRGLPLLEATNVLPLPRCGFWDNQTESGNNKLPPSVDRSDLRATTYPGIAAAMAEQWGSVRKVHQAVFDFERNSVG